MKNLKPHALIICIAFIASGLIAQLTKCFRYNIKYRWLYEIGAPLNLVLLIGSFIYSFIILIFLFKKDVNLNIRHKFLWLILALLPFLCAISVIIWEVIKSYST